LAREFVGDFVSVVTGLEIEVLRHPTVAVCVVIETDHISPRTERASVVFATDAVVAAVTREEERECNPVALLQRPTE
jgi:hypothetical protein